ncbi:hydroxymethylpyrimidine/phosphomethylpyrimidine kinase [Massilia sp. RP-1-19]|uniref:hydroxymethylpyrimidine kinase n=1 Tax=Massilia polaris TaxID=2728846 RepID=A0A848HI18_9BURK|nr:hydroxymethylpyrimidine/phosphomethylpyrimidine kinase [Massilia polaris]
MQNQSSPLILCFGVSDPSGATGIQSDLACFSAHGCHGLSVTTALLIADTAHVDDMHEIDADWVIDQARVLLEDMPIGAFKVGALASVEQVAAVAEIVSDYPDIPMVLDPFLSSLPDSGLLDDDMLTAVRQILVPQAALLLVSQVELARMAETWRDGPGTLAEDVAELTGTGCGYVLVTGTGSAGGRLSDTLYGEDGEIARYSTPTLPGPFIGAGSTISGTLAAMLASGADPLQATPAALAFTAGALAHAQRFGMGKLVPNKFFNAAQAAAMNPTSTPIE